jgi:superfamily II DNA or RNA helicase
LSELKRLLPHEEFSICGKPMDECKYGEKKLTNTYTLPREIKTKLYDFQYKTFNEAMNFDKYLLLLDQGLGKAQPLYSKILTPNGYITMGEVKVGTEVMGEDGKSHKVLGVFPQGKKPVYEVTFSDGSRCRCSDEHLWTVKRKDGKLQEKTLKELMEIGLNNVYFSTKHQREFNDWKFYIPITKPIEFEHKDVQIDPWLLGVILGDGGISTGGLNITNSEQDIIERIESIVEADGLQFNKLVSKYGYSITDKKQKENSYKRYLKSVGLMGHKSEEKFVPDIYKYNDIATRLSVLQGLFATDGYVSNVYLTYATSSRQLAKDIIFLVQSLGGTCSCKEHETFYTYKGERKQGLNNYEMVIKMPDNSDLIKTEKQKKQYKGKRHTNPYRNMRKIEYIGEEECQCILVDNPSHLYITDDMIVTHNTIVSISCALKRKELGQVKHCLVICGVNGLKYSWEQECLTHANMSSTILGNRQNKKGIWQTGSTKDKLDDLEELNEFFIITNVESLRSKEIKEKLKRLMDKGEIGMVIFDEIHKAHTSGSQQGKALLLLSKHVKYFLGLTGTPITNSPLDAYVPLKCVDGELANLTQFKSRYCVFGGWGGYQLCGFKNMGELQQKIDKCSIRLTKDECLDLPEKIYINEYVEMGADQKKIYSQVMLAIMEDIDNISLSLDPLSQMIRARQATASTAILSSTINKSAKIDRLKELLEEIDGKVVVFSNWTKVTNILEKELAEYNPAVITGEVKDRESQRKKFYEDGTCKVLIGTIGACGTGYTFTCANTVIFMDEPFTASNLIQATDRLHRIGQYKSVNVITLMCKNTIDERIHKIVEKKRVMSDTIIDKKYDIHNPDVLRYMLTGEKPEGFE